MIRVLHVLKGMNRGGIENFLMNLYRRVDRSLLQFDFLVHTHEKCTFDEEVESLGGRIFRIPSRRESILENRKRLKSFFDENSEYRIVHQHVSSLTYLEPLKAAMKNGVRTRILNCHSTNEGGLFIHKYLHNLNRLTLSKYANYIFVSSGSVASWLFGEKKVLNSTYRIMKYGIDTSRFAFRRDIRNSIRSSLGIEENMVIGHLGRFAYPKNHLFLIDIFRVLHERRKDAVLLLVGDGELREEIRRRIVDLGLEGSVIFTGIVEDQAPYLLAMDVFVFPSHYEGFPLSLLEAQASGLPCVISDSVTSQARVTENVSFLSLKAPPEFWSDKIESIALSKQHRSDSAVVVEKEGYDIDNIAAELQHFYLEAH